CLSGCPRHRLGDRTHAADRVAPGARYARRFAEQMVQQDVGRSRRLRRGEIAYYAVKSEQRLGELAFKMAVEDVGRATNREIVDDPSLGERQAGHILAEAKKLGDGANSRADVWRRPQQPFLEQPNDRFELVMIT